MIARHNLTRERLNRAARATLKQDRLLCPHGLFVGGRAFAPGDRVIARRNDRRNDIDNGSLATVIAVDEKSCAIIVETDAGQPRTLGPDYIAQHLEHAYALTAHSAQGATVSWAGVIGRPQDFTREWAYTALSRARQKTTIHLVRERSERECERNEYAPEEPNIDPEEAPRMLHLAMKRCETEQLAAEQARIAAVGPLPTPATSAAPISRASEPNGLHLLGHRQLQRNGRRLAP
jgi:hypothetical protein